MPPRNETPPGGLPSNTGPATRRSEPFPVDVVDRGREFLVTAELPGLQKQALDVTVRKDRLQIAADYGDRPTGQFRRKERRRHRGPVARVIRLPGRVDEKHVSASYDDGVLRIRLQKRRRPRRVDVE